MKLTLTSQRKKSDCNYFKMLLTYMTVLRSKRSLLLKKGENKIRTSTLTLGQSLERGKTEAIAYLLLRHTFAETD